ncbi:MAG: DotU family type IV/VI secretion system protein [Desulfobacterales bacterium]|jgi:type VI secretion system protein ImpK|nr:DotU family type IV/VI secretion system protein [Desulfobacterales bacterium]
MRLTDCFMELIAYVAYFLKTAASKQPAYQAVKAEIDRLISNSQLICEKGKFAQEDYNLARFAVFAWIDEAILSSEWKEKNRWQAEQLQRVYYQTTDAGELFYDRLNTVGLQQRDVREVYYLCLAMGFTGRHCHAGDEFLLDQLKSSNLKILTGNAAGLLASEKGELFPEGYAAGTGTPIERTSGFRFSLFTLFSLCFPVGLYFLLFLIYRFVLSNIGDNLFATVR